MESWISWYLGHGCGHDIDIDICVHVSYESIAGSESSVRVFESLIRSAFLHSSTRYLINVKLFIALHISLAMANAVYATLSAFTTSPESGNPAAVVILPPITDSANPVDVFARFPADTALQAIATRFNLPMTAFLLPLSPGRYALRWFTPASEAWICGHATVALSHLLFNVMGEKTDKLSFETIKHGTMHTEARQQQDSKHVQIAVDFPEFTGFIPLDNDGKVKGLLNSLQVEAGQVEEVSQSDHYVLVELKADANLKSINLDEKYLVCIYLY